MPLIKDGRIVADSWARAESEDELAPTGDLIVPLALWQAARERLLRRNGRLGLALAPDEAPELVADDVGRFAVIALGFPKFTDGRAYSSARLLRERYGFAGELRATGNVLSDQLQFMLRCGFDAFEVADERLLRRWDEALGNFSEWYQPAALSRRPIPALRRQQLGARPDPAASPDSCAGHWAY
jgi:uncharacterized protein (DUF934 family)